MKRTRELSYLLDVNFLLALFDPRHVNHEAAHHWFRHTAAPRWATCSVTENGCVRILSNPAYRTVSATPTEVMARLQRFCDSGGIRSGRMTSRCAPPWIEPSRIACRVIDRSPTFTLQRFLPHAADGWPHSTAGWHDPLPAPASRR